MKIANILAAIDGEAGSEAVLDAARSLLAAADDAVIRVVCVLDLFAHVTPFPGVATEDSIAQLRGQARQAVDAAVARLRRDGRRAEGHVVDGRSATEIIRLAREWRCDLIVLGHRHMSFWRHVFDPSTCFEVLEHAPCPVLIATR